MCFEEQAKTKGDRQTMELFNSRIQRHVHFMYGVLNHYLPICHHTEEASTWEEWLAEVCWATVELGNKMLDTLHEWELRYTHYQVDSLPTQPYLIALDDANNVVLDNFVFFPALVITRHAEGRLLEQLVLRVLAESSTLCTRQGLLRSEAQVS